MMKRILGMFLACALVVSLIPVYTNAASTDDELAAWNSDRAAVLNACQSDDGSLSWLMNSPRLSGASVRDVGDNEFEESEANNSIHAANLLEKDYTVYGALSGTDRDFYAFELARDSEITVVSIATTETASFVLYDSKGTAILGAALNLGIDENGLFYDAYAGELVAGTYYLVFLEMEAEYSEYVFYFDYVTTTSSHTHSYFPTYIEPWCTTEGYTVHNCSCGLSYTNDRIPALGHEIDPDSYVFNGTDTTVMEHRYSCKRCSSGITEACTLVLTAATEANIASPAKTEYTCSKCTATCADHVPYRIYGATRFETSFQIANALKESLGITRFDTILIANANSFADALPGSYLAAVKNAPILLYGEKYLSTLQEYISANLAVGGTVYLLGGPNALPQSLETSLKDYNIKRLWGQTRYETNLAILNEAGYANKEILVCTGTGFADSLSASATGKPILLVSSSLSTAQKTFLSNTSGKFVIIGGENAVSKALEAELKNYGTVERLSGSTRYETSVMVAERFFQTPDTAILAYSLNFPDGLCGGPLAYSLQAPMILTITGNDTAAAGYAQKAGIVKGAALGGPTLISDDTVMNIIRFAESAE